MCRYMAKDKYKPVKKAIKKAAKKMKKKEQKRDKMEGEIRQGKRRLLHHGGWKAILAKTESDTA